jgi:uncharacterized protein YdhG (YjbR/CyaY superfamily)
LKAREVNAALWTDTSIENLPLISEGGRAVSAKPQTIDEYLAPLSAEKRAALEKLRKAIKSAAPGAEECISYQIPGFRLGGRLLVSFGAAANHCAFYPGARPVKVHSDELEAYETSKGTIRFPADSPLPATLVRKLVKTRIAEHAAQRPVAAKGNPRR